MGRSIDKINSVLYKTAKPDPFAVRMLESQAKNNLLEKIAKKENGWPSDNDEDRLDSIMEGMKDYIMAYNAPPIVRQKHWKTCQAWSERIAREWNITKTPDLSDYIAEPVVQDTKIALIQALHSDYAKTKKELMKELNVSDKTIQNGLRSLCPALQESGEPMKPFRIAGQEIRAGVREETVSRSNDEEQGSYKGYLMPDRLHPIFLQLSTIQAAHLLISLQKQSYDEGDVVSHETAIDVWSQLSPEGKQRIKEVYCSRNKDFADFIEDIDGECEEGWLPAFHTEDDLRESMDCRSLLESAFKCGIAASLTLDRNGERTRLRNVRIRWGEHGGDEWLAIPENEWPSDKYAERFSSKEIHGQIELHQ